jgi:hypothetical protein
MRDRTSCTACPLGELCQAGFEEQILRFHAGENPSLTDGQPLVENPTLAINELADLLSPQQFQFLLSLTGEKQ